MVAFLSMVGIDMDLMGLTPFLQLLIHASIGFFMWALTITLIVALVEIYERMLSYRKATIISHSAEL